MTRWPALIFAGFALLNAQPQPVQNWTVIGKVNDSVTGRPIADAQIVWEPSFAALGFKERPLDPNSPAPNASRTATDAAGAFTISVDGTATGARLFISRAGYRSANGNATVALSVGPNSSPVLVSLIPRAGIQGRITNGSGAPLPGITVNLTRIEIRNGRRQPRDSLTKLTTDKGEFSFDDIPAGSYYLRAAGAAYGPVYYPTAFTQEDAQLMRIAAGSTITADFRLESHAAYRIRGIVTNMPLRRSVAVRLLRGDDPLGNPAAVGPNGTFEVSDVAPGSYTLQAYTPDIVPPSFGEVEVMVEARDTAAVRVTLNEGLDIAGHIEFRGSGSLEKYAVLSATPYNPRRWPGEFKDAVVTMQPNGNFVFKNLLPGKYDIKVRGLPNAYLAEITAESRDGSADAMEAGLTVPSRNPPTLEIVMKAGGAEITGTIDGAEAGRSFSVALVTRHGAVDIPELIRAVDGHFHIASLTPGEYTLLAWPEAREVEYRNPTALTELLGHGTQVTLGDGAKRSVTLTPVP